MFSFKTEDAVKVSAQGNYSFQRINLPEFEDCTAEEVIQIVEEEFEENDTSILEELYIQYDTYYDEYSTAYGAEKERLLFILNDINEAIENYGGTPLAGSSYSKNEFVVNYQYFNKIVSVEVTPNSYFYESGIEQSSLFVRVVVKMAVVAIATGFAVRGWKLAADLLWHNLTNKIEDSSYTPKQSLVNRLVNSTQIKNDLALNNLISGTFNQVSPGRLNGLFEDVYEGDAFNSLGAFYYGKSSNGNGSINLLINDRYDWDRYGNSPGGILISILVLAQEIGVVVPFYTKLNLTMSENADVSWQYSTSDIIITGAPTSTNKINIPNTVYDLRVNTQPLPMLPVTTINPYAFLNNTSLTEAFIPQSVTTIGEGAFYNTGNANINFIGRTSVPSSFNLLWNKSENPVYFDGVICSHTNKNYTSINANQHGSTCTKCRTTTNIVNHSYNYLWRNYKQHSYNCVCQPIKLYGHAVSSSDNGFPYKTCLQCGGPADTGFVHNRATNSFASLVPSLFITEYFGNGSYLLDNGVYIISDADLDDFYNGNLILPSSDEEHHDQHEIEECCNCI